MVINPNLIPQSVNVVIGEGLYELKFRVELNGASGAPQLMDMDGNHKADGPGQGENNGANHTIKQITLGDKASSGGAAGNENKMDQGAGHGSSRTTPLFFIQASYDSTQNGMDLGVEHGHAGVDSGVQQGEGTGLNQEQVFTGNNQVEGVVEDVPLEDDLSQADSMDTNELEMALTEWGDEEENSRPPSTEDLAAIPEASPEQSEARRSKRRAGVADEKVGVVVEHRKALRNEGTSVQNTPLFIVNEYLVISNLNNIGISLGNNEVSISDALENIK
jgi:hypothetical protein